LGIEPNFEKYTGDDLIEIPGCGRGGSAGGRGGLGYGGGFGQPAASAAVKLTPATQPAQPVAAADAATRSTGGAYRRRDPYYLNLISFRNLASFCADYNLRLINPALQLFCFCPIKDLNRSFAPE
jgi:hypothetical protein